MRNKLVSLFLAFSFVAANAGADSNIYSFEATNSMVQSYLDTYSEGPLTEAEAAKISQADKISRQLEVDSYNSTLAHHISILEPNDFNLLTQNLVNQYLVESETRDLNIKLLSGVHALIASEIEAQELDRRSPSYKYFEGAANGFFYGSLVLLGVRGGWALTETKTLRTILESGNAEKLASKSSFWRTFNSQVRNSKNLQRAIFLGGGTGIGLAHEIWVANVTGSRIDPLPQIEGAQIIIACELSHKANELRLNVEAHKDAKENFNAVNTELKELEQIYQHLAIHAPQLKGIHAFSEIEGLKSSVTCQNVGLGSIDLDLKPVRSWVKENTPQENPLEKAVDSAPMRQPNSDPVTPKEELGPLLREYFKPERNDRPAGLSNLIRATQLQKIVDLYYSLDTDRYVRALGYLDGVHRKDGERFFELAKALQLRWETKEGYGYSVHLYQQQLQQRQNDFAKAAGGLGGVALAIAIVKPNLIPKYFRYFRAMYVPGGLVAGKLLSDSTQMTFWLPPSKKPAPAAIMNLGLAPTADIDTLMQQEDLFDSIQLATSVGSSALVADLFLVQKAYRAAETSTRLARWNPWVLAGTVLASIVVDVGVDALIEDVKENNIQDEYLTAYNKFKAALIKKSPVDVYAAAENLYRVTVKIHHAANLPIYSELAQTEDPTTQDLTNIDQMNSVSQSIQTELNDLFTLKIATYFAGQGSGSCLFEYEKNYLIKSLQITGRPHIARENMSMWLGEFYDGLLYRFENISKKYPNNPNYSWAKFLAKNLEVQEDKWISDVEKGRACVNALQLPLVTKLVLDRAKIDYLHMFSDNSQALVDNWSDIYWRRWTSTPY